MYNDTNSKGKPKRKAQAEPVKTNRGNGRPDRPSKERRRAERALLFDAKGVRNDTSKADAKLLVKWGTSNLELARAMEADLKK